MRDRLWREPPPPRALNKDVPPWLQEVILRALHPNARKRYQSAAQVAFDLRNPAQVALSYRAARTTGPGFWKHLGRWRRARGKSGLAYQPRHPIAGSAPVIMVAVTPSTGRRAPSGIAMDHAADDCAQSRLSLDVRIGDPRGVIGRGRGG